MHLQKYFCPCSHAILSKQGAKKSRSSYSLPSLTDVIPQLSPACASEGGAALARVGNERISVGGTEQNMLHPAIIWQRRRRSTHTTGTHGAAASTSELTSLPSQVRVCQALPARSVMAELRAAGVSSCLEDFRSHRCPVWLLHQFFLRMTHMGFDVSDVLSTDGFA